MDLIRAVGLSGLCHGGEERFKDRWEKREGGERKGGNHRWSRSWKWDRMGRSILEHGGLSVKYVSPAVPAVFYSRRPLVVPACVQGDRRQSGKAGSVGMGSSWCHQVLVIAGKLAS